ncbi:MAG: ABC transporter permease [Oscillospiraceae bacterium]|jgi:ribose/xylose/arabinose/galactoside ABC-type transport system permease subunit|nr:ABC transporter permease [Oscillospiraceae bacterium]
MENVTLTKRIFGSKIFPLLVIFAGVVVLFTAIKPDYIRSTDNIRGILNSMSLSGTIGVGMACLLIGGGVDLSAGAVGCFAGVIVAMLIKSGMPWGFALVIAMLLGGALGAFNAFLINGLNFTGFIATIGVSSMLQGLTLVITRSQNVAINNDSFFLLGKLAFFKVLTLPFIIMVVLLVIYGIILSRTRFGRTIYMCGGNRMAARMSGLSPKKVTTILYVNCSMLSALGGSILAARMHSGSPTAVVGRELDAITAAVLGGVSFMGGSGSMLGCFVGLLLLNSFNNGLAFVGVKSYWTIVAQGALLIVALVIDYLNQRAQQEKLKQD